MIMFLHTLAKACLVRKVIELRLTHAKFAAHAIPLRYSWPSLELIRAQASCRSFTSILSLFIAFSMATRASVAT